MATSQWPQQERMEDKISSNTCSSFEAATSCSNIITNNNNNKVTSSSTTSLERKIRPEKDEAVNCPRCNSNNTKFCYYNNYSLTQPRYFCKTCKRYWTEGGSLRNIPVGGASRKNKRSSSSSSTFSACKRISSHDLVAAAQSQSQSLHLMSSSSNPNNNNNNNNNNNKIQQFPHQHQPHQDLNLGFPLAQQHHQEFTSLSEFIQLPTMETTPNPKAQLPNSTTITATSAHHLSALELLNGLTNTSSSSRGLLTPFIPIMADPNNDGELYSSGYHLSLQELSRPPSLNFSLDAAFGNGYGGGRLQGQAENTNAAGGRLLFPFEDLKHQVSSITDINNNNDDDDNNHADDEQSRVEHRDSTTTSTAYWSGMLDAGGSW